MTVNNTNSKKFKDIHDTVLNRIRPTKKTSVHLTKSIIDLFEQTTQIIIQQRLKYKIEPILVGSTAKDTYLVNPDIDLFIMFPLTVPVEELRNMGLIIGRAVLPDGEERYAEHPYISGKFEGFDTDIVPCYKLSRIEDRMTAVDRTPFHTRYVIEHIQPEQHDEVRLLKQFMKGIGVYGAEIEIQGFSGYLCELLILKYDTLLNLLKSGVNWPNELVLSLQPEKESLNSKVEYEPKSVLPKKLAYKFKDEPLVFIDPIDKFRNVASAVENNKLELFKTAAKKYLLNPDIKFYFPNRVKPLSISQLMKILKNKVELILGLEFPTPEIIPDILYGQLRKSQRAIHKLLTNAGFEIIFSDYYVNNKTLILFELKNSKLPNTELHQGPPEGHINVNDFLSKWEESELVVKKPFINEHEQRWYVEIRRKFTTPDALLNAKIFEINLGKQITPDIKKELKIYRDIELLSLGFEKELTLFLNRKYSWEY
jgi:tRNA nucleotidyltransferase (CCA-adding enzyme)